MMFNDLHDVVQQWHQSSTPSFPWHDEEFQFYAWWIYGHACPENRGKEEIMRGSEIVRSRLGSVSMENDLEIAESWKWEGFEIQYHLNAGAREEKDLDR